MFLGSLSKVMAIHQCRSPYKVCLCNHNKMGTNPKTNIFLLNSLMDNTLLANRGILKINLDHLVTHSSMEALPDFLRISQCLQLTLLSSMGTLNNTIITLLLHHREYNNSTMCHLGSTVTTLQVLNHRALFTTHQATNLKG